MILETTEVASERIDDVSTPSRLTLVDMLRHGMVLKIRFLREKHTKKKKDDEMKENTEESVIITKYQPHHTRQTHTLCHVIRFFNFPCKRLGGSKPKSF